MSERTHPIERSQPAAWQLIVGIFGALAVASIVIFLVMDEISLMPPHERASAWWSFLVPAGLGFSVVVLMIATGVWRVRGPGAPKGSTRATTAALFGPTLLASYFLYRAGTEVQNVILGFATGFLLGFALVGLPLKLSAR